MMGKLMYFVLFYCLFENHTELVSLNPILSCKTEMNVTRLFQTPIDAIGKLNSLDQKRIQIFH